MIFLRYESFRQYLRLYPVTSVLLGVLILIHLADSVTGHALFSMGAFALFKPDDPYGLAQPWRYATSVFLHSTLTHLLYNCFSLLVFAPPLERLLGHAKYALFLILSGVLGNIMSALAFQASNSGMHVAVGASGAIYGVFGAYLFMALFRKNQLDDSSRKTVFSILIFGLIYSVLSPRIDIWGHVGGGIGGFLLFAPFNRRKRPGVEGNRWN